MPNNVRDTVKLSKTKLIVNAVIIWGIFPNWIQYFIIKVRFLTFRWNVTPSEEPLFSEFASHFYFFSFKRKYNRKQYNSFGYFKVVV